MIPAVFADVPASTIIISVGKRADELAVDIPTHGAEGPVFPSALLVKEVVDVPWAAKA